MQTRPVSLLGVAALLLAAAAWAQAPQSGAARTVTGSVVSSTADTLVIRTAEGTEQTFSVDAQSQVPAGLSSGTQVSVSYHVLEGGRYHAARVTRQGGGQNADAPSRTPDAGMAPGDPGASSLPSTASAVPQLIVAGLGALAGALALRRFRRAA